MQKSFYRNTKTGNNPKFDHFQHFQYAKTKKRNAPSQPSTPGIDLRVNHAQQKKMSLIR